MSHSQGDTEWRGRFTGFAPLFPLANVVLFPKTLLPLHIFEPRYRRMTADCLSGDRLMAMAMLRAGMPAAVDPNRPPICSMVGLGQIVAHQQLPDGRYYLVLRGVARAHLLHETDAALPYRVGRLEICDEPSVSVTPGDARSLMLPIIEYCRRTIDPGAASLLDGALVDQASFSTLCDLVASTLPLKPQFAQRLFEELNPRRRYRMIATAVQAMDPQLKLHDLATTSDEQDADRTNSVFPPAFSRN